MDDEFYKQLIDRFEAHELVDFLDVETSDVIEGLYDIVKAKEEELREFIHYGR